MAVNIGVRSKEELDTVAAFWEAVLETTLEDWNGQGRSRQARVGQDAHAFFFNLRIRNETEPIDVSTLLDIIRDIVEHHPLTAAGDHAVSEVASEREMRWEGAGDWFP